MCSLPRLIVALLTFTITVTVFAQDTEANEGDASSSSIVPATYDAYIVQSGDSLFIIAERFNTTIDALKSANDIGDDGQIIAGQTILIPTGELSLVDVYEVVPGDTLFGISKRFNTSVGILQALNDIEDGRQIVAGQRLLVPALDESQIETYIVESNDSLFSISKRYNTVVSFLKSLNGIVDDRDLEVGQTILVPKIDETEFKVYEVLTNDSLYSIARRFATTEETLMSLNGIANVRDLEVGQNILVPRIDQTKYEVHVVELGDTLFNIARLYNTTVAQLRALNGIEGRLDLPVGRSIIAPKVDQSILERYIVQSGDSLYSIAKRFNVSLLALQALNQLADIRDIRVDQAILVPKLEQATLAVHVVQLGDTLEKIAQQYETTVELLQSLNGIADPSLIVLDESILVPEPREVVVRPGFGFGIQVFTDPSRATDLATLASQLGVNWVKIDVSWAGIETAKDVYSYAALDSMIAAMEMAGVNILLNVYDAPDWSRTAYTEHLNSQFRDYGGPPEDYSDFAAFLANLVTRYAGLVDAYEIWKSPNLLKYWTVPVYHRSPELDEDGDYGVPDEVRLGASYYVGLLEIAYNTIKSYDEDALVITGGLAPVGFTDNYNSIDTGTFLSNMLGEGADEFSDGIGAIFSASAVPPTLACCAKPPGVGSHYESFLQYFGQLLAFYDEVLLETGVDLPIVVTQLGWGTSEGDNLAIPSSGFEWLEYTSEDEQALYVTQAYQIAQSLDNVSTMFLYNLNGCAVGDEEACFFSLVDAGGEHRPVFPAYEAVPKSAES